MRPTNIEWITRRMAFILKLSEKTGRQREIIRLLDIENRTSLEQKQLHVLATAEKNELQRQETQQRLEVQERIAGMLTQSGLVDKVTGKPNYDKDMLTRAFTQFNQKLKEAEK